MRMDGPIPGRRNPCPRFDSCSAPICPLDPKWPTAQHLPHERVCGLLTELVKAGGEPRLRVSLPASEIDTLISVWQRIVARWRPIAKRLAKAARSGSRIHAAHSLTAAGGGTAGSDALPLPLVWQDTGTHGYYPLAGGLSALRDINAHG
jgi:hypothetical protein